MKRFEQDPTEALDYSGDFELHCARLREAGKDYATNTRVRPARSTGFQYNATTGGRSGTDEPRWPETVGGTVTDGSVVWTAEAVDNASLLRTLSSATWTPDTGLTKSGQSESGCVSTAILSAGTLGQSYLVRIEGTLSDGTKKAIVFMVDITRPRKVSA